VRNVIVSMGDSHLDAEAMGANHSKFTQLKEEGKLFAPDVVGKAIAGVAVSEQERIHGFSGKFVNWDDDSLSKILA
jgi:hypothetical protein